MRILFLNPVGVVGGGERCIVDVIASLREKRPEAEIHLITGTDGPMISQVNALGAKAQVVGMPAALTQMGDSALKGRGKIGTALFLMRRGLAAMPAGMRYIKALRRAIREINPDVVHSNGIKAHVLTALLKLGKRPLVWHAQDFFAPRPLMAKALRWASRARPHVIAITRAVGEDSKAVLRGVEVTVVYSGVDTEKFSPAAGRGKWLDELAGMPPAENGTLRVGIVAAYARWKGQDLFLKAAAKVLQDVKRPVRFFVIGGPIYKTAGSQFSPEELKGLAQELGIRERVGFVGFQTNPAPVYQSLDVMVHASTQPEPLGLTILESMACGRPTVVANAGGAAELFTHGEDAMGFVPGNVDSLAGVIRTILEDDALREKLGRNARASVEKKFDRRRLGPEVLGVYERLLQR